jgi:peptide/nickel transport system ATP-binding protein
LTVAAEPVADAAGVLLPDPVLEIRDLHLTFPGPPPVRALRGVSLTIAPGEVVGLVGESGSGKTVLGLAAVGLLPPVRGMTVEGEVRLGELDMASAPEAARRAKRGLYVGAVFQDPMAALNPSMQIGRQVAEAAGGADGDAVAALLADAGIPAPHTRVRQYPHELSGGLRQRVMIAMAVARSPSLVVADEPTTALDVTVQAHVLRLLARLRERGMSVLLVTHDLAVAATICDRIAVAYAGRIVECGRTAALIDGPAHPYTLGLLASRPLMDGPPGRLASLVGRMPDGRDLPPGCAFAPRCPITAAGCAVAPTPTAVAAGHTVECHRAGELARWPAAAVVAEAAPASVAEAEPDLGLWTHALPPGVALRVEHATREFGGHGNGRLRLRLRAAAPPFRAVDDVSLELRNGGSLAIVGESGSGKTTLLRMIVGLLEPTAGTIAHGPGATPQLIFQDAGASLTPWLTVGRMLGERLASSGVPRAERAAKIVDTLTAVGLSGEVAGLRPPELSGGQRQRAAIARAVIVPPALLACDEPVSALDVSLAAQVLNLLGDLRRRLNLTILFVTHDLAVARAVADEVLVMSGGAVVERGETSQVLESPRTDYTRALLDAVPKIRPARERAV